MPISKLPAAMKTAIASIGISQPTDIQTRCWPSLLSGRDVVGIAPTGSGKTLAYILPLAEIFTNRRTWLFPPQGWLEPMGESAKPGALILVPTRELCQQVAREAERILSACVVLDGETRVRVVALHGGEPRQTQLDNFKRDPKVHVLVATPGRLIDLHNSHGHALSNGGRQIFQIGQVRYIVLDEADKLLLSPDLMAQVKEIRYYCNREAQLSLFTATLAPGLPDAASELMTNQMIAAAHSPPLVIKSSQAAPEPSYTAADEDDDDDEEAEDGGEPSTSISTTSLTVPLCIKQEVSICAEHKKPRRLLKLLEKITKGGSGTEDAAGSSTANGDASSSAAAGASAAGRDRRVLIFANKIKAVAFIGSLLTRHRIPSATLSSKLTQRERDNTLRRFQSGELPVLVSTDVAARGVHIEGLTRVVLWDFGTNLEQYVQRIGRTGRQGQPGTAYAFWSRQLRPLAPSTVELLKAHGQKVDPYLEALAKEVAEEKAGGGGGGGGVVEEEEEMEEKAEEKVAVKPPPPAPEPVASSDDDDMDDGGAQRWLASKLVSPITGMAPVLTAKSGLAKKGKKKKRKREE